jgi:hypothetical protein
MYTHRIGGSKMKFLGSALAVSLNSLVCNGFWLAVCLGRVDLPKNYPFGWVVI